MGGAIQGITGTNRYLFPDSEINGTQELVIESDLLPISAVPEPAGLLLLGVGIAPVLTKLRHQKQI